jgi:hypothetical protein
MKWFWKYIFPFAFGLLIYASIRAVNDTTAGFKFWKRAWETTAIEIVFVIGISYMVQAMLRFFTKRFDKQQNRVINGRTILKEFATVLAGLFLLLHLVMVPMMIWTDDGMQLNDYIIAMIFPGLYVLLYFAILRGNYYLQSFVDQKIQLEKLTNDHLQTELKFLKSQYHPHFLFNALNSIYFQMDGDIAAAKNSVEKFSELLRYQLYDQHQTVNVRREINYLNNYIELQRVRCSERLKVDIQFDPMLDGQQVYPLLLLPMVENAFKFVGGEFWIRINGSLKNGKVEFTVSNAVASGFQPVKPGGIGLENLRRRLALLYPGKHELEVTKEPERFTITLKLALPEKVPALLV